MAEELEDKDIESPAAAADPVNDDVSALLGSGLAFVDVTDAVERVNKTNKSSSTTDILRAAMVPPSGGSSSSKNYIEYRVFIRRRDGQMQSFFRRYRKFKDFDDALRKILPEQFGVMLKKLPPKERWRRMFGLSVTNDAFSDMERDQISELTQVERRKLSLRHYLRECIRVVSQSRSILAMQFVARFFECNSVHAVFIAQPFMFELRRLIRVEGDSEVWVGRDLTFDRKVVKVVIRKLIRPKSAEDFRRLAKRVKMARLLSEHPNVIALHEVCLDDDFVYLVRQLSHGNLVEVITADMIKRYNEGVILEIATHLLSAMSYAHSRGVVHMDLNMETVRFGSDSPSDIQVFGFELPLFAEDFAQKQPGALSVFFTAPELLVGINEDDDRKASDLDIETLKASDMWSIGIILYVLATGRYPFCENNRRETIRSVISAEFQEIDCGVSDEFWSFMSKVLLRDPSKRLTAKQAFDHKWITSGVKDISSLSLDAKVLTGLAFVRSDIDLKRRLSFVISKKHLQSISRSEITRCFKAIDTECDGTLDLKKITRKLEFLGFDKQEASNVAAGIIRAYDADFDGIVQIESFISTSPTMKWKLGTGRNVLTLEDITKVFRALDTQGSGYVDAQPLEEYFRSHFAYDGNVASADLHSSNPNLRQGDFFSALVEGADIDHDGVISFEELIYALQCLDTTIDPQM
eukprot:TRINITY_DN9913_c0_g1_i1.p1 TRINITY_DN9913_c0_g1~~TRINITY_DN9913_c0_g1_i1.p1  ORF type:complete len:692 (-),score=150.50 TRINITY_DN9913_c0_g1_i1:136-2211(-)